MKYYRLTRSTKTGQFRIEVLCSDYRTGRYWKMDNYIECPQNLEEAKAKVNDLNTPEAWEVVED